VKLLDFMRPNYKKEQFEFEIYSKRFFIKILMILGFPTIGYFIIQDFIAGKYLTTFFLLLMFTLLTALFIALCHHSQEEKKYTIYRILLTSFISLFGVYLIYTIGVEKTFYRIYWSYLFPILVFFTMGIKAGLLWTLVFYSTIAFLVSYSDFQSISLESLKIRFLISFFLVSTMSFISAYLMRRDQQALLNNQQVLRNEIEEREQAEKALRRSEEEAKQLAQESAIMSKIGQIISSTLNIQEVYERFADEVDKLIPFDRITINIINPEDGTFTISYVTGFETAGRHQGDVVPLAGTATEEAVRARMGLIVQTEDEKETATRFPALLPSFRAGLRSMMMVPLISKDQVIGVLHLQSAKPNAYSERNLRLAERVGTQIAGAIANAQLFAERKRAEEERQEKERFLTSIFGSIQDGISILDLEMNIIRINQAMEQWYSHALPLVGKKCYEAYHSRSERCDVCPSYQTIKTEQAAYEVVPKRGPGGKVIGWLEVYSFPLMDVETGQMKGVIEYVRDITERKRAEELLQKEREIFFSILENAPYGVALIDLGGKYIYINPEFTTITGYTLEDVPTGRDWFQRAYPDPKYKKEVIETWKEDQSKRKVADRDFSIACKDGQVKRIEFRTTFLDDGRVVTALHDITERKRTEEALKESEERYRTILENIEDGYYEVDLPGNFTFFNDSLCRMLGYSKDEMIGMGNQQYTDEENRKKLFQAFNQVYRTGKPAKGFDWEVFTKDGKKLFGEVSVSLIKDSKGQPTGFRGIARDITQRKQAEEALRAEKQRFQTLLENAPFGMVVIDKDGSFKYINPKFIELFGFDLKEIPNGKEWFRKAYPDPDYRHYVISMWKNDLRIFEPGEKRSRVFSVACKNGAEKIINFIPVQLETAENLMACEDITERKRAEEALQKSRQMLESTFISLQDAVFIIDAKTIEIIECNPAASEIFGYSRNELVGKTTAFLHLDEASLEEFRKHLYAAVEKQGFLPLLEFKMKRKDGTSFPTENSVVPLEDDQGNRIAWVSVVHDITERKRAEEALRVSEEKYRTILENIEEGYYEVDTAGNFTFVNDSVSRILGYSKEELMGMNDRQYSDEENGRKLYQTFNKVYRTGEPAKGFDWEIIRKNGTKRFVEASVTLLKDSRGQPWGFRGIARDITERKRAEQEMATLQEQFRHSQRMEAIGRLAGGIAHDFNNLLTVIRGYSQLSLLELKEGDKVRENIEEVQRATQRATDLTRQLLAFGRRQIMDMKVLDLNMLLKDLDKMLRRVIGEDIQLVTLLPDDLGRVKTDPGQIEQVILNLAVNARDAMPHGGKLIIETRNVELDEGYARTRVGVTPGPYVMFSMTDTGCGMSLEVKEHIFEPFFTTKEKGKGTGLGLSTVYGIVKQSGGNIWAYSEPDKGATFKIYLPRVDEPLKEIKERVLSEEIPQGSETILAVEDEEKVRKLAVQILKRQGYTVLEASHGDEAMKVAKEHGRYGIHLLLTDVVMPGMSGSELAKSLGLLLPKMKVLYMSGYTDNAIVHHGVLEEGVNYIQKPFTVDALARKVREVLDR
jgi:two-component system cell cycle sensor histidine kinase/response regulator CckA